jgi:hypothetical protein
MDKTIIKVLLFLFIFSLIVWVYFFNKSFSTEIPKNLPENQKIIQTSGSETMLNTPSVLAVLISEITPLYVVASHSPQIIEIENALTDLLVAKGLEDGDWIAELGYNPITLLAANSRYVIYDSGNPYSGNVTGTIFDVETEQIVGSIPETYLFATEEYAIYAEENYLCRYTFGSIGCEIIPESSLTGSEVYGDSSGMGGNLEYMEERHTNNSITISVFIWSKTKLDSQGVPLLEKVREVTYSLP